MFLVGGLLLRYNTHIIHHVFLTLLNLSFLLMEEVACYDMSTALNRSRNYANVLISGDMESVGLMYCR